jgi:hypothetical protein
MHFFDAANELIRFSSHLGCLACVRQAGDDKTRATMDEFDGTKRKAESKPDHHGPLIDLDYSSPPWMPPVYHVESALRSTQASPPAPTINPENLEYQPLTPVPPSLFTSPHTALQSRPTGQVNFYQRPGPRTAQQSAEDEGDDDDEYEVEIETDNGADGMYMINCKEGSWSGTLPGDDPDELPEQAAVVLEQFKRSQKSTSAAILQAFSASNAAANNASATNLPADRSRWQIDLLLRNIIRRIKTRLLEGAVITLEHLGPIKLTLTCAHPLCQAPGRSIPAGAYYAVLGHPRKLESVER